MRTANYTFSIHEQTPKGHTPVASEDFILLLQDANILSCSNNHNDNITSSKATYQFVSDDSFLELLLDTQAHLISSNFSIGSLQHIDMYIRSVHIQRILAMADIDEPI